MSDKAAYTTTNVSMIDLYDKARELNYLGSEVDAMIREVWDAEDFFYLTEYVQRITAKTFRLVYNMLLLKPVRIRDDSSDSLYNAERYAIWMLLNNLGDTSEDVARTLAEKNVDGLIGSCSRCPIANYLHQETQALGVSVASDYITVRGMRFQTPLPVAAFINAFDDHAYQGLIGIADDRDYLGFPGA